MTSLTSALSHFTAVPFSGGCLESVVLNSSCPLCQKNPFTDAAVGPLVFSLGSPFSCIFCFFFLCYMTGYEHFPCEILLIICQNPLYITWSGRVGGRGILVLFTLFCFHQIQKYLPSYISAMDATPMLYLMPPKIIALLSYTYVSMLGGL